MTFSKFSYNICLLCQPNKFLIGVFLGDQNSCVDRYLSFIPLPE